MNIKDVYTQLCSYDPRNGDSYEALTCDLNADEIPRPRTNCYCGNCFAGRDALACEIIRLTERIDELEWNFKDQL